MEFFTSYDEAMEALEAASADVTADFGEEGLEDAWADVVSSVARNCDKATAREFCRTQLGYIPHDLVAELGHHDWVE